MKEMIVAVIIIALIIYSFTDKCQHAGKSGDSKGSDNKSSKPNSAPPISAVSTTDNKPE